MSTISSRVGGPPRSSRSEAASRIPGVQKPHWRAWFARNASCSGPHSSALDGLDLGAVRLHGEQQARADGDAVEPDGARAADAVLAPDVRPGQSERVAQEVGEQEPRLDLFAVAPPVDRDVDHVTRPTARSTSTRTSWRW